MPILKTNSNVRWCCTEKCVDFFLHSQVHQCPKSIIFCTEKCVNFRRKSKFFWGRLPSQAGLKGSSLFRYQNIFSQWFLYVCHWDFNQFEISSILPLLPCFNFIYFLNFSSIVQFLSLTFHNLIYKREGFSSYLLSKKWNWKAYLPRLDKRSTGTLALDSAGSEKPDFSHFMPGAIPGIFCCLCLFYIS